MFRAHQAFPCIALSTRGNEVRDGMPKTVLTPTRRLEPFRERRLGAPAPCVSEHLLANMARKAPVPELNPTAFVDPEESARLVLQVPALLERQRDAVGLVELRESREVERFARDAQ